MGSLAYAKAKGRQGEQAIVDWLIRHGWQYAERRRLMGTADRGDIAGVPGCCVEVKSVKRIELAEFVKELEAEMANDQAQTGVVVIKRRGHTDPDDWFFVMPGHVWRRLMREAGY